MSVPQWESWQGNGLKVLSRNLAVQWQRLLQGSINCMKTTPVNLLGFCSTISTIAVTLDSDLFLLNSRDHRAWVVSVHLCHSLTRGVCTVVWSTTSERDWKAANSDTSDDSIPFAPTHPLPSRGEKYSQIRSTSWIQGPVATKWSFQQDCFALVSKLLLLFMQTVVPGSRAKSQAQNTSDLWNLTVHLRHKGFNRRKKVQNTSWKWQFKSHFHL